MASPRSATTRGGGQTGRKDASQSSVVASGPDSSTSLTREQRLELYYWMRLTRSLEERLVNLYRQTKVVGGLFRSLGQEADAVGSAYALRHGDILSPLIRNLGSMLVKGATPVEILKQYMAKGDSPTRGRELNIHFGDTERGFIGQISPLGDMVPVMAGVTLTFKLRGEDRVGLVYVGDGATSTGAFHEGINFAAVQRCPLVVVIENNGYAYSTPTSRQTAAARLVDNAIGYGIPGERADGNDVIATYEATKRAVDRARRGEGTSIVELMSYRRKGHAEHDNQSYVPEGEIERWARENDPIDRYVARLSSEGVGAEELAAIDARVVAEIDEATDIAEQSGVPEPLDALEGIYADPPREQPLWFREGKRAAVDENERPESWGTYDISGDV
jgi:TPP-dependent pyruvate/acetoin dehydrogenase alpha subunit